MRIQARHYGWPLLAALALLPPPAWAAPDGPSKSDDRPTKSASSPSHGAPAKGRPAPAAHPVKSQHGTPTHTALHHADQPPGVAHAGGKQAKGRAENREHRLVLGRQGLSIEPAGARLRSREDQQQFNVSATLGDGSIVDLTSSATFFSINPHVATITRDGLLSPVGNGSTTIVAKYANNTSKATVSIALDPAAESVSFLHDVEPVLARAGCNQGGCHGKATGQNGFKLSLFGFDTKFDFDALVKEGRGRRIAVEHPDDSLLLLKASATLPHGGGKRLDPKSAGYRMLRRWIAQGAPYESSPRPNLVKVTVSPEERLMGRAARQHLLVTAHYDDGSKRDVTREALFRSNEEGVAAVDETGLVTTGKQPGEAAVMAGYMGQVAVFRAAVPMGAPKASFGAFPPNNFVDDLVLARLKKLGIPPSNVCSDAEFLRRVSVDLCGRIPKPEEVKAFLAESGHSATPPPTNSATPTPTHTNDAALTAHPAATLSQKAREHLVDRLLEDPDYASYFALKWAGILRNTGQYRAAAYAFHSWLREAVATNKPYDQFVREIVAAQGEWQENPPTSWFWQFRDGGVTELTEDVAQLFLGQRLQCAKCHHHPYEKWGQDDFYGLAGFFTRMGRKIIQEPGYYYVSRNVADGLRNPRTGQQVEPKLLEGAVLKIEPGEDPRQKLVDWMVQPDNPYFAPTIVNRMWAHFFGRGLVDPIDDMRVSNPPTNPELLKALSDDLVRHHFDLKHLIRTIVTSRTYQLSSEPNKYNGPDRQNYARHYPRRLPAEVLFDAVDQLTGVKTQFQGVSAQARAVDLPHENFNSYFLDVFGRPKQLSSPCECARDSGVNLSQVLHLTNSGEIDNKIGSERGRAAELAKSDKPLPDKIEELFLCAFGRPPDEDEKQKAIAYVTSQPKPRPAFEELIWTFLNCREFQFNH
jgi:hypothetical protein